MMPRGHRLPAELPFWAASAATSFGYGVVLPVLPRLLADVGSTHVATGHLMAAYSLAVVVAAPLWGLVSSRWSAARVVRMGLVGQAVALSLYALPGGLALLVASRVLLGVFAAATLVGLLAQAAESGCDASEHERRLSRLSRASIIGGLLGPSIGGLASNGGGLPVAGAAGAVAAVLAGLLHFKRGDSRGHERLMCHPASAPLLRQAGLMALGAVAAAAMALYEVGLATRGAVAMGLSTGAVGAMFAGCGLVMLLAQTVVFRRGHDPLATFRWVGPAFAATAVAFGLIAATQGAAWTWSGLLLVAAAAGVLQPALAFWAGRAAGSGAPSRRGWRTAFTTCGQALGSLAGAYAFSGSPSGRMLLLGATAILVVAAGAAFAIRRRPTGPA